MDHAVNGVAICPSGPMGSRLFEVGKTSSNLHFEEISFYSSQHFICAHRRRVDRRFDLLAVFENHAAVLAGAVGRRSEVERPGSGRDAGGL